MNLNRSESQEVMDAARGDRDGKLREAARQQWGDDPELANRTGIVRDFRMVDYVHATILRTAPTTPTTDDEHRYRLANISAAMQGFARAYHFCSSCERSNCLVGHNSRRRNWWERTTAYVGQQSGKSMMGWNNAMQNAVVIDTEARWYTDYEAAFPYDEGYSQVTTPADPRALTQRRTDLVYTLNSMHAPDTTPSGRTIRPPTPQHITKGLVDAVNALPKAKP